MYSNVWIALRALLTILVMVDHDFLKLKLIKAYLRSTIGDERLSSLAI